MTDNQDTQFIVALGRTIAMHRVRLDLTQGDLSDRSGIPRASISRFEKAQRTPDVEQVNAIASALGLTTSQLVGAAEQLDLG